MKLILFILLLLNLNSSFADCPLFQGQFNVNFNNSTAIYDYSHTAIYLKHLSGSNQDVLGLYTIHKGLYKGDKSWEIKPHWTIMNNNSNNSSNLNYCAKINSLNITINFNPVIYIANETNGLSCIYKSVLIHERKHYDIEVNALNTIHNSLVPILLSQFDHYF